jgi:23S rRNA (pseudouridine1915-N3)-methyltransferase
MNILIASVGKPPKGWMKEGIEEFVSRLKGKFNFEWHVFKNDEQLIAFLSKQREKIFLDPQGKLLSSESFSSLLFHSIERGGATVTFVIGGAEGLPSVLRTEGFLLSLSPMTFTHQMTPLILLEQIYRASEIEKGTLYHK